MDDFTILPVLEFEGARLENISVKEAREKGVPEALIEQAYAKVQALAQRDQLRSVIAKNVGDTESILGTIADDVGLLVALALADIVALSTNTTFTAYRTAKLEALSSLSGDADIAALAGAALAQIQSGEVKLTAGLKGLDAVLQETLTRSTQVTTILAAAAEA